MANRLACDLRIAHCHPANESSVGRGQCYRPLGVTAPIAPNSKQKSDYGRRAIEGNLVEAQMGQLAAAVAFWLASEWPS
jgi:hypothetical protein